MKASLFAAAGLLATAACAVGDRDSTTTEPVPYDGPMNVMLVIWDTVRADHLGAYGYHRATTPNLSAIAESSTLFQQAIPGSYWTTSSVASLISGMASHNHQVDFVVDSQGMVLDEGIVTMAEAMQARGYRTAMYTNQNLVYSNESFQQGFDEWKFLADTEILSHSIAAMDAEDDRPWFTVAYWMGAHAPYNPPAEYDLWADPDHEDINVLGCDGIDPSDYPDAWECFNDINNGSVQWSDEDWDFIRDRYDGSILEHDAWLGELWDALETRGLSDSTLFAFTADHGEALNDHGQIAAWHVWPYDDTQLVPLVVRLPGVFPATVRSEAVRTMDLYATMMELTEGEEPLAMDGDRVTVGATKAGDGRQWYRHGGYKIIYSRENEDRNERELFDLAADPNEQDNLWDSNPELVEELKAAHAAYLEETSIAR
jgi:arylsulfatase A-like enzyme